MFSLLLKDLISDFIFEVKNYADRLYELRKARDMAVKEARNYANKARDVERRKIQNEETEAKKKKTLSLNTKENLKKIPISFLRWGTIDKSIRN